MLLIAKGVLHALLANIQFWLNCYIRLRAVYVGDWALGHGYTNSFFDHALVAIDLLTYDSRYFSSI